MTNMGEKWEIPTIVVWGDVNLTCTENVGVWGGDVHSTPDVIVLVVLLMVSWRRLGQTI